MTGKKNKKLEEILTKDKARQKDSEYSPFLLLNTEIDLFIPDATFLKHPKLRYQARGCQIDKMR